MGSIPCTGDADCPFCKMGFEMKTEPKMMVNVIDHKGGKSKVMTMDESRFKELFAKVFPKGTCWHLRLWKPTDR